MFVQGTDIFRPNPFDNVTDSVDTCDVYDFNYNTRIAVINMEPEFGCLAYLCRKQLSGACDVVHGIVQSTNYVTRIRKYVY